MVDTYFQDVLPDLRDGMSDLGSNLGDNFDGGSITSSNFYESGERRKVAFNSLSNFTSILNCIPLLADVLKYLTL
jgi:hypothetical protein